jgi:hypothetical protein
MFAVSNALTIEIDKFDANLLEVTFAFASLPDSKNCCGIF